MDIYKRSIITVVTIALVTSYFVLREVAYSTDKFMNRGHGGWIDLTDFAVGMLLYYIFIPLALIVTFISMRVYIKKHMPEHQGQWKVTIKYFLNSLVIASFIIFSITIFMKIF